MSGPKSNSTRLPPRVAPAKKRPGKKSKAARRKMVERENAEKERINENIDSCTDRLIGVLSKGGVSNPDVEDLRKEFSFKNEDDAKIALVRADSAVEKSWSFASCYPSIDVNELVSILNELCSFLSESADIANKPVQRRLDDIRSNPKADPNEVETAEEGAKQIGEVVTQCNVGSYKIRALRQIVSELDADGTAEDLTA